MWMWSKIDSVPNRCVWACMRAMRSGPCNPSTSPGQLSTSVVVVICPPISRPVIMTGSRFARAAYRAAVHPAGPEPRMRSRQCRGAVWGMSKDSEMQGSRVGEPAATVLRAGILYRVGSATRCGAARPDGPAPFPARLASDRRDALISRAQNEMDAEPETEYHFPIEPGVDSKDNSRPVRVRQFPVGADYSTDGNTVARQSVRPGRAEAILVGLAAAALFLAIAISSYHRGDPSWSVRNGSEHVVNRGGVVGAWISDLLLQLLGTWRGSFQSCSWPRGSSCSSTANIPRPASCGQPAESDSRWCSWPRAG